MMKAKRGLRMATEGLLAALLIAGAGPAYVVTAQGNKPAAQPKKPAKAAPKKAPVRRVARPRVQRAPTRARIIEIQQALAAEGSYTGKPSGRWDAKTTQAMKDFQISKGLTPTGKLGALSLQKLGLGSEIAGKAAPTPQADARPSALSDSDLNDNDPDPEEQSTN
jgi:peptidoglycan hydrolase-like protein with peptidoglycan-binding domain